MTTRAFFPVDTVPAYPATEFPRRSPSRSVFLVEKPQPSPVTVTITDLSHEHAINLSLSSAVLTNGARLLPQGSGGLQQRITVAQDVTVGPDARTQHNNFIFSQDSAYVWTSKFSGTTRQYDVQNGTLGITLAGSVFGIGLTAAGDYNSWFLADYNNNKIRQYDWSGNLLQSITYSGGAHPGRILQAPSDLTHVWIYTYATNILNEYSWTGLVATGRTLTGSTATNGAAQITTVAGVDYIVLSSGTTWKAYRYSDLVLIWTWTPVSASPNGSSAIGKGAPGLFWEGWVDSSGLLYSHNPNNGFVDRYISGGGSTIDKRIMWSGEFTNSSDCSLVNGSPIHEYMQISPDGKYAAYWVPNTTDGLPYTLAIQNIQIQRARWSYMFPFNSTVKSILVPGILSQVMDGSLDYRKAVCYYSSNGGSSRTVFSPSTPINVIFMAGTTITIDVDMNTWEKPGGMPPFIGGDAGEGVQIRYSSAPPNWGDRFNSGWGA